MSAVTHDPHPLEAQASIGRGICPYCDDERTFRNVTIHIVKGHGIDAEGLRDEMGVPKRLAFASVETRTLNAQRATERNAIANVSKGTPGKHRCNSYGRRIQREKSIAAGPAARKKAAATWRDRDPAGYVAAHRKAAGSVSVAAHRKAGRLGGLVRAQQMTAEVRADLIARRESNASAEYRRDRSDRMRRLGAENGERARRPHPCPVCGANIPKSTPLTCSESCAREQRRRSQLHPEPDHGLARYRRACRCDVCRAANAAVTRIRRAAAR